MFKKKSQLNPNGLEPGDLVTKPGVGRGFVGKYFAMTEPELFIRYVDDQGLDDSTDDLTGWVHFDVKEMHA